jgi:hypothetical protein
MHSNPLRRGRTAHAKDAGSAVCSAHERPRTRAWALALALSMLAALPIVAHAAESEVTRESYVASVEPICKANKSSSDRLLKPVKSLVKSDELKQASQRFTKAAAALERAQTQLAAVPQPPADAAKLTKWLAGIRAEARLMRTIAAKLKQANKARASSLVVKLTHDANTTNNLVIVFQFDYCKIDPGKYT